MASKSSSKRTIDKNGVEFGKFTNFMRRLVAVPHSEIKVQLDAEKQAKRQRQKRASSRVSRAGD
jgi:hypothetical protein